jgi:hypothetical protein
MKNRALGRNCCFPGSIAATAREKEHDNKERKKKNSGVPCTALPADIAAISTGVDWFFNHSSICFFFSVTISPMPMLIALEKKKTLSKELFGNF